MESGEGVTGPPPESGETPPPSPPPAPPGYPMPPQAPPPGYAAPPQVPQPGYGAPAGYPAPPQAPPPGYAAAPGFAPQYPGYPPQPGYAPQYPGYPAPQYPGYPPQYPGYNPYQAMANQPDHMGSGDYRARGILELLDAVFTFYRRNFTLVVGATAIIKVPFAILRFALLYSAGLFDVQDQLNGHLTSGQQAALANSLLGVILLLSLLDFAVLYPLVSAVMARITSDRYLGREPTVGGAYRAALGRFWALLGTELLTVLILFGVYIAGFIVLFIFVIAAGLAGIVLGAIGLVVLLVCIYYRLCLAVPIVMLEGRGPGLAVSRTFELTRRSMWRGFWTVLIATLINFALGLILSLLVQQVAPSYVAQIVAAVVDVFTAPILPIMVTLIYYDRRIRREAFDVEMLSSTL